MLTPIPLFLILVFLVLPFPAIGEEGDGKTREANLRILCGQIAVYFGRNLVSGFTPLRFSFSLIFPFSR